MRRLLVLLLAAGLLGAGATAVDAKPRKKSPRLHAFASCTNLLGYAQRNGLRVIRDTPVALRPPPVPESGGGSGGGGEDRSGAPVPVAAPVPAAGGEGTSQTNVQEAGVDEPDWVKAAGLLGAGATAVDAKPRKKSPRLHAFASCTNLLGYAQRNGLRVIRDTPVALRPPPVPESGGGSGGGEDRSGAPVPVAAPVPAAGGEGTSQTNVQEAGVDEPDWVKAAGTTLYVAREGKLRALDASGDRPRELGAIDVPGYTQDLLVRGDRALVIATTGYAPGIAYAAQVAPVPPSRWLGTTRMLEVDVSDPAHMKVLRTLDVEGSYLSARLTGATARVILRTEPRGLEMPQIEATTSPGELRSDWRRSVRRTRTRAWLPSAVFRDRRRGTTKRRALVRCRQVRRTQSFSGLGTLTVLTIDMERGLPAVDADALMTDGDTVYASQDRLYVASQRWLPSDAPRGEILDESATGLHAFSTEKAGETAYVGSGEVPGYLLNQWSLSEHEGTLRAATTSMPPWESDAKSESAVRTLQERDGRLVQVGSVGGLGRGERIYAVRYIGDTGFVVTFRQVDPLYTLDLSDPKAPRVAGELKVPGYSAYLHPLGDGLLLGVGQDATEAGRRTGVQLSLFDATDLAKPVRLDQHAVGANSYTPVEGDHHAFLWWAPERLAVIPAVRYAENYVDTAFAGSLAYRVTRAGGIAEVAQLAHPRFERLGDQAYERSVVMGGRLLLVSSAGVLSTFTAAPGPGEFLRFSG